MSGDAEHDRHSPEKAKRLWGEWERRRETEGGTAGMGMGPTAPPRG